MEDCTKTSKRIARTVEVEAAAAPPSMSLTTKWTKCSSPPQLKELKKSPSTTFSSTDSLVVKMTSSAFLFDELSSSRFSNNDSLELVKDSAVSADLEEVEKGAASTYKTSNGNREAPFCGDSEQTLYMDSPDKIPQPDSPPMNSYLAAKVPSQAEIDEFFSKTEKREQAKFAEKYNFDVAKEVPLEGRYQWERVKP